MIQHFIFFLNLVSWNQKVSYSFQSQDQLGIFLYIFFNFNGFICFILALCSSCNVFYVLRIMSCHLNHFPKELVYHPNTLAGKVIPFHWSEILNLSSSHRCLCSGQSVSLLSLPIIAANLNYFYLLQILQHFSNCRARFFFLPFVLKILFIFSVFFSLCEYAWFLSDIEKS